jgi:protein O-GlcNAc transferase
VVIERKVIGREDSEPEAAYNLATDLRRQGRVDEAESAAAAAARLSPAQGEYHALHAALLLQQGFASQALAAIRRAIQCAPHRSYLRSQELFMMNLIDGVDARELAEKHRAFGGQLEVVVSPRKHPDRDVGKQRLRIGYVSSDLRGHPVTLFLLPVLERRTRERFEVYCYSSTLQTDEFTSRVQAACDRWIDARPLSDMELAQAIADDGIDVLVDLNGHSGQVRMGTFAAKPAPLQFSWLGYLNTTGLSRMDFRLTDASCDPPNEAQALHSERLQMLPHSQWCYRPFIDVASSLKAPFETKGFITFGSLNNAMKLTPQIALRWGRILRAIPDARMVIADIGSEAKRQALLLSIVEGGGDAAQVTFAPRIDLASYYRMIGGIDIALDSQPYGGGTTTLDALWMGVPVVTARGALSCSRSASSILTAMDLRDWIAPSLDEYESLAVERARDVHALSRLRRTLRERLHASVLMDEALFTAEFEAALERMWKSNAAAPARTKSDWRSRGNAALGRSQLDEAAQCYRRAIDADAADPQARVSLAYVLLEQGRAVDAAESLHHAIALATHDAETLADAHYLLAQAQRALGHDGVALDSLRAALAARPAFEQALQELVPMLLKSHRAGEALSAARRAVDLQPTPACLMQLAQALHAHGDTDEALRVVEAVLAREPGNAAAMNTQATLLLEKGRANEALDGFDRVVAQHGADPDTLCNRAAALHRLGRADESLQTAEAALRLQPAHKQAMHARGRALLAALRISDARDATAEALKLFPEDADLQWNSAVAHLLLGEFEQGWRAHEARWNAAGFAAAAGEAITGAPRWTGGESLANATILLFSEQGLGDVLQFLRYVPLVAARAREVLLRVPPEVAALARGLAPNCRVVDSAQSPPAFDFQCPLLSLPHAFGTTLADVPSTVPYLRADTARSALWRDRLSKQRGQKVGIMWSGNPRHTNDHNRSIALEQFRAIADAPATFINLQPRLRDFERDALAAWPGLIDAGPELHDFGDTAALVMALDLVITVDTSVAHLAGALGRTVWILLPFLPDWRWMIERTDSPWYPTARLYRQPVAGSWDAVLQSVRADLCNSAGPQ